MEIAVITSPSGKGGLKLESQIFIARTRFLNGGLAGKSWNRESEGPPAERRSPQIKLPGCATTWGAEVNPWLDLFR